MPAFHHDRVQMAPSPWPEEYLGSLGGCFSPRSCCGRTVVSCVWRSLNAASQLPLCLGTPLHQWVPLPSSWMYFSLLCRRDWSFFLPFLSLPVPSAAQPNARPGNSCPTLHAQLQTSSLACAGTLGSQNDTMHSVLLLLCFLLLFLQTAVCSSSGWL